MVTLLIAFTPLYGQHSPREMMNQVLVLEKATVGQDIATRVTVLYHFYSNCL